MYLLSLAFFLLHLSLLVNSANATHTLYERSEEHQRKQRLAYAQVNYDPSYVAGPAVQARDLDDLIQRMQRREASNAEFYKKQGIIKDLPENSKRPGCKQAVCTPEEMKLVLAYDDAHNAHECKSLSDCKCPKGPYGSACMNGKCLCGEQAKPVYDVAMIFAKPIMEGLAIFGQEVQRILGDIEAGLKMALKLGTWLIPGLGPVAKAALKGLDAALPPAEIQTGNKKADDVLRVMGMVL